MTPPHHHYLVLLSILLAGLVCLIWFRFNHAYQIVVALVMGICYIGWGIIHHHSQKDLHFKIVAEYILMFLLAILLLGSVLYWG